MSHILVNINNFIAWKKNPTMYFGISHFFFKKNYKLSFIFHEQGRKKCQNGISYDFSALLKVHFFRKKCHFWHFLRLWGHHRFYKERITATLTSFELNPTSISLPWIENKFYSLDEERLTSFRSRLTDSTRYKNSSNRPSILRRTSSQSQRQTSRMRCKDCYSTGHINISYPDKSRKRPPSVPFWISNLTCAKCKKKGHMAFNCPPKYDNKIIKHKNTTPRPPDEKAAYTTEFAGAVHAYTDTHYSYHLPCLIPSTNKHKHSYTKHNTQKHSRKPPTDLYSPQISNIKSRHFSPPIHKIEQRNNFFNLYTECIHKI